MQQHVKKMLMEQVRQLEADKIHFAVMAIGAAAELKQITPMEMHHRLEKVGLLQQLLLDCYDVMHTQSIQHVAEDVVEALDNWEKTKG